VTKTSSAGPKSKSTVAKVRSKPKTKAKPKVSVKEVQHSVLAFIDEEVKYWREQIRKEREEGVFFLSKDDRYNGAIAALRRLKGKLAKEVFVSRRSK